MKESYPSRGHRSGVVDRGPRIDGQHRGSHVDRIEQIVLQVEGCIVARKCDQRRVLSHRHRDT